jgi:hypothetical protein
LRKKPKKLAPPSCLKIFILIRNDFFESSLRRVENGLDFWHEIEYIRHRREEWNHGMLE